MILDIPIVFYNSKGRKKEVFKSIRRDVVKYYSCGPTVYDYPHVGNMFSFTLSDLLRRLFTFWGYKVVQIMNITDVGHLSHDADMGVEDRIMKALGRWREQGKKNISVQDIIDYYTAYFIKYLHLINIKLPHFMPFASHHVKEMQDIISCLLEKGYAYKTKTAVYYDVTKFSNYNKLYPQALEEKLVKAREEVVVDETKKHPADFRLWQLDQPNHIMQWDTPWGRGFPGWHIECSAMSMKYGGHTLDLHTGGIDHIPVHHTNEIAQSEACTNEEYANYWLHNQHVKVSGQKMAKSLGNFKTLDDLVKQGYKPWHVKMFYTLHHYRSVVDFTPKALDEAVNVYTKVLFYFQVAKTRLIIERVKNYDTKYRSKILDSLNKLFPEQDSWVQSVRISEGNFELSDLLQALAGRELDYINLLQEGYDGQMPKVTSDIEGFTYERFIEVLDSFRTFSEDFPKKDIEFTKQLVYELSKIFANDLATPQLWSLVLSKLKKNYTKNPLINLSIIALASFLTGVPILPFVIPVDYEDRVLGSERAEYLSLGKNSEYSRILKLVNEVNQARSNKEYEKADSIKQKLLSMSIIREVVDFPTFSMVIV